MAWMSLRFIASKKRVSASTSGFMRSACGDDRCSMERRGVQLRTRCDEFRRRS
jgi:hypothetical protein